MCPECSDDIHPRSYTIPRITAYLHTQLIKACKDLSVVQQQLGHADIRTTMSYSDVTEERKRNAVELLDFGLQEN